MTEAPCFTCISNSRCSFYFRRSKRAVAEQLPHLFVRGLSEVFIMRANGVEWVGRHETDYFIALALQRKDAVRRTDGDGEHQLGGILLANCTERGAHGASGGDPIVDHDDHAPDDRQRFTSAEILFASALDFPQLP